MARWYTNLLLLWLLLAALPAGAQPYMPAEPEPSPTASPSTPWQDTAPFSIRGVSIGTPTARVEELLGKPTRVLDPELMIYQSIIMVRSKNEKTASVSAGGAPGTVVLFQGERELAATGMTEADWLAVAGPTLSVYRKDTLTCLLYHGLRSDVGVLLEKGLLTGFVITEPQMCEWGLKVEGFQEDPSVPIP